MTRDADMGNLAILPVDTDGITVRKQKGETSPAVGWHGVLGEYPAWDVTLETQQTLPARLDAVLFPMPANEMDCPKVERLVSDENTTAFRIVGPDFDDTFILCEEGTGIVTVGDIAFEGRALLLHRQPEFQAISVNGKSIVVGGETLPVT